MATLSLQQARDMVAQALRRAGANETMAAAAARALVLAEAQGLGSHGLSRVSQYATHLRNGRVNGQALPSLRNAKGGAALVDAHDGLAFAACDMAIAEAIGRAREFGISVAGVTNSHHAGVLVDHLRPVAEAGLVGLGFANSPAAMPAAGGRHPIFGTNPVAAAFPRRAAEPLMIDLSLSEVARGKLMMAAREGQPIPLGWALDAQGRPTTDPKAGLEGSMLPIGAASGPKGAMLALVVELLVTALIGAQFGFEASSFFVDEGNRPRIGQTFIVIDPGALAGTSSFLDRVEVLVAQLLRDEGLRLPGVRREQMRGRAEQQGVVVPDALLAQWAADGCIHQPGAKACNDDK
jgi:(2R)-3-sulfolactate dehydrogenase (NADP+)